MNTPLVSIIIPAYNSAKYLPETIQSALGQTWANKEIINVDDGSTDDSVKVASGYAASNKEIKVTRQENKGAATARNTGLKESKGVYIQFLDADDLLSPTKIETQMNSLGGSQTRLSMCDVVYFNNGEKPVDKQENSWYSAGTEDTLDFLKKLYAG